MKKLFSILLALTIMTSLLVTAASAAPAAPLVQATELGQLKVCKVAGSGVEEGMMFAFRVDGNTYNVPAGPVDRGYCVLAGQYPIDSHVTIEEVIPPGYYVSRIEVRPDRTVDRNRSQGTVTVRIVSGVIEAIFTNKVVGTPTPTRTPTSVSTSTPRPTRTPTSTPSCAPNCTPTSTPIPTGRMQICKEADGLGVTGYFTFRFETNRSRQVPVGACAGLTAVNAGILTVTEVQRAGYAVSDIYTIPADRLISTDLNGGSAQIRIVEGTAASQTIVIFRNRATTITATPTFTSTATSTATGSITPTTATPTSTATATSTPTGSMTSTVTPPPATCPPTVIYADFSNLAAGDPVEGLGRVAPFLNIDARGTAVKVEQAINPAVYVAPNNATATRNGGLSANGGFSDLQTRQAQGVQRYTFTFAPSVSVSNFSLHMLDFGDFNPAPFTSSFHYVSMTAYDAGGNVVDKEELNYSTPADVGPRSSNLYGDLQLNGDAVSAPAGQPGNWTWNVTGNGIVRVALEFATQGYDPNFALDLLSFTTECASCQSLFAADFNSVAAGQSVEGLGAVSPHLNIDARGTAIKVAQAVEPLIYLAPNRAGTGNINGGLVAGGGFSDLATKNAMQAHRYSFTFASDVLVTDFSLHMLDFGDLNPTLSTSHSASMTAYDINGNVVDREELRYTTPGVSAPDSSNLYGNMRLHGDAVSAPVGQPGNWTWNLSANGITSVVLEFGAGHDPNIALDLLFYNIACQ
jgi:hypothetical protein